MTVPVFGQPEGHKTTHLAYAETHRHYADDGTAEINWLSREWETTLTLPTNWKKLHKRGADAPLFLKDLRKKAREHDQQALVNNLLVTDVNKWQEVLDQHANDTKVLTALGGREGVEQVAARITRELQEAGAHFAAQRDFRLNIAKQLNTSEVANAFKKAAVELGDKCWSTDHVALAKVGKTYTDLLVNGAKLEALSMYLKSGSQTAKGAQQQTIHPMVLFANLEPLDPLVFRVTRLGRYPQDPKEFQDTHHRLQKTAAEARDHTADFITKLAQGQYDGLELNVTIDPKEIRRRETALATYGKTQNIDDPNGVYRRRKNDKNLGNAL